jgi:hypothetical protein
MYIKYNVVYDMTGSPRIYSENGNHGDTVSCIPDSNMYYMVSDCAYVGGSCRTWVQWQGYGKDVHSITGTNPGFQDAPNGNYSRPEASSQMNGTYGGQTWTLYGAIQGEPAVTKRLRAFK